MADTETSDNLTTIRGRGATIPSLADPKRNLSDARLLRRLIRSPIYVPNDYFREAAKNLWDIASNTTVEDRARINAIKAINEICKINLLAREKQSDKPNLNLHLHKHEVVGGGVAGLSESELLQLKALMEKAGLTGD